MPQLPTLDYEYTDREVTDTFAGYNHKLKIGAGEFYDTENLTSAYYPLLAERKKRGLVKQLTAPGGLLGKEELAYVDNGTLYYNGEPTALTGLTAGEKQLVSMGAYICVFPDKKYYNTADAGDHGSMEAYYTSTGTVKYTMCRADGTEYAKPTVSAAAPEEPENAALTAMPYHNARHLPDGADPITVKAGNIEASAVETAKIKDKAVTMAKLADHAVSVDYTATLNTTWSGSAAPYTKEQTINGILATDKPLIDIVPSATFADAEKQADAWALIYRAVTAANKITFYAKAKPAVSIPLQIRCIRK